LEQNTSVLGINSYYFSAQYQYKSVQLLVISYSKTNEQHINSKLIMILVQLLGKEISLNYFICETFQSETNDNATAAGVLTRCSIPQCSRRDDYLDFH